jgi:hypothetical protein
VWPNWGLLRTFGVTFSHSIEGIKSQIGVATYQLDNSRPVGANQVDGFDLLGGNCILA